MRRESGDWREDAKKRAALEAVKHVENGFVVGLGSGSTVAYAIEEMGRRVRRRELKILGVPTSSQASSLAVSCGIPTTTLDEHPQLDLTIDGADQIDRDLNLIKGMGGALTREKIVASASNKVIIVADETKLVDKLGVNHPVPVEVLPFALSLVVRKMGELGGKAVLRKRNENPFVTDNGNFVLDVDFGPIDVPGELDLRIRLVPGVVETGLFVGMVDVVYCGGKTGVEKFVKS